jgi:hypothetical protein
VYWIVAIGWGYSVWDTVAGASIFFGDEKKFWENKNLILFFGLGVFIFVLITAEQVLKNTPALTK